MVFVDENGEFGRIGIRCEGKYLGRLLKWMMDFLGNNKVEVHLSRNRRSGHHDGSLELQGGSTSEGR